VRPRILFAAALVACLCACVIFAAKWQQAERRADDTARWTQFVMDSLGTTLRFPFPPIQPWGRDTLYWQWVATSAQMQSRRWQLAVQNWARGRGTMLDADDIESLRNQGLSNPAIQLRDSLQAHPELIPYKAVLGGTMRFEGVVVLRPPFIFAEFEDGHIGGSMLLEYEVLDQRKISWKRLWSRLE
jgi:hypothetical protein